MIWEKRNRVILIILLVILAILAYIYFVLLKSGGGIISAKRKTVDNIEFLFSIYGPGRGDKPYLSNPLSVATDARNNIYVSDTGNSRVVVFNSNGGYMFEFGTKGVAYPSVGEKATWKPGALGFPYGIDVDDENGNIFVADMTNKRIDVFDNRGNFLDWFPKTKLEGGYANDIYPTDIAVKKGKVYVCNPYQIIIFNTKGELLKQIGMPGNKDDKETPEFDRPNGIDVGSDGTIYVADSNNLRLMAMEPDGKLKWIAGKPSAGGANPSEEQRVFGLPRNVAVASDGNIYVADPFHFQIKVFSPQGHQLAAMGQRGTDEGQFNFNNGIVVTDNGVIYVVDKQPGRVQAIRFKSLVFEGL